MPTQATAARTAYAPLAALLAGNFITILDVFIVNVALPEIQRDLDATDAELQLVVVAYSVAYGAMLLNGARLGDRYGRRRLFLAGMAVFGVASLLASLAPTAWSLIAARAIQGFGAALLMPQVYTSIRLLFDGEARRRAFAIMGAVQGVAGAASQLIGGLLIVADLGGLGWRLVFAVNLPVVAYALIAGRRLVTETRADGPIKLDLTGAVLGASALTAALLPIMVGREQHWPWWSVATPLVALPLFGWFAAHEAALARRGGAPIIALSLFQNRDFVRGIAATFLFFSAIGSFSLSLTVLLQVGLGWTALDAAMLFLPSTVAFFLGSLASAPLERRQGVGTRGLGAQGLGALGLGMAVFAAGLAIAVADGLHGGADPRWLGVSVILQGFGQGVVIPLLLNAVLGTVASAEAAMAAGAFSTLQVVGSAFGVTVVGAILFGRIDQATIGEGSHSGSPAVYAEAFALASLYNLAAVCLGLALFARRRGTQESD